MVKVEKNFRHRQLEQALSPFIFLSRAWHAMVANQKKGRGMKAFFKLKAMLCVYATVAILAACSAKNSDSPAAPGPTPEKPKEKPVLNEPPLNASDKRRWIEKAFHALVGSNAKISGKQMREWETKTRLELLDLWMQDPRFGDTITQFGLSYIGFPQERLRPTPYYGDDYVYAPTFTSELYGFPQVITATKEIFKQDGDFLKILELQQPSYVAPLSPPFKEPNNHLLPDPEARAAVVARAYKKSRALLEFTEKLEPYSFNDFCAKLTDFENSPVFWFFEYGLDSGVTDKFLNDINNKEHWYGYIVYRCNEKQDLSKDEVLKILNANIDDIVKIADLEKTLAPEVYPLQWVQEIRTVDLAKLEASTHWTGFNGLTFAFALSNSSTNYNRKRAAYVLKHYFCDDLTPINVEDPGDHAKDAHGKQSSCYACHYKLDPMAGFFRNYGALFTDFSQSPFITFDDMAKKNRSEYEEAWKAEPGSGRTWNVGYIRSPSRAELNTYGENFVDLFSIIRTAPEVKTCLIRRTFEFFNHENQLIDPGYLDYLSKEFSNTALKFSSAEAMRNTIKMVLLGNTFLVRDPEVNECYDLAPGQSLEGRTPCKVNFILQNNCVTCHGSQAPLGGLDLTQWKQLSDGTWSFPFVKHGVQLGKVESLNRIINRISSSDVSERMPLGRYMPPLDREALFLWAQNEIKTTEKKQK